MRSSRYLCPTCRHARRNKQADEHKTRHQSPRLVEVLVSIGGVSAIRYLYTQ